MNPCPNCGYCPHCRRANPYQPYPYWSVIPPYPVYPNASPNWMTTSGGVETTSISSGSVV